MRVILFPNGSVVNSSIDINLIPGETVQMSMYIPGYVAGSLSLVTDLIYDYTVEDTNIVVSIYVPPSYGGDGITSMVVSYATVSIYGTLLYRHDIVSDESSRSAVITNNSGSPFRAEIGIAEGDDIYTASNVSYGIVGTLDVNEGTETYPLDTPGLSINVIYNVFAQAMNVNLVVETSIGQDIDPLPGTLELSSDRTVLTVPITSGVTILGVPENVVEVQEVGDSNQYVILVEETSPVRVVMGGSRSLTNAVTGTDIPYTQEDGAITFLASPGSYLLK